MHRAPPIQLITPLVALKRKRRKTQAFTAIVLAAAPKRVGFRKPSVTLNERLYIIRSLRIFTIWKLLNLDGQNCLALLRGRTRQYKFSKIVQKQLSMRLIMQRLEIFCRCSQKSSFTEQLEALLKGKPLGYRDKLLPLGPFLDDDGWIRATGLLTEAPLLWATKHPIILNSDNHITRLFIQQCHEVCMYRSCAKLHPTNALHFPIENNPSLDIFPF